MVTTQQPDASLRGAALLGRPIMTTANAAGSQPPSFDASNNAPQPDYNGEGHYDWQKCQQSNDPDCWKQEGERVHSYWKDFGHRMKTFWKSFGHAIRDFFAGKEKAAEEDDTTTTTTTATTKKKHYKKKKNSTMATEAPVDDPPVVDAPENTTAPVLAP
mmetsp:Transcript_25078/g.57617  ORF Transcript_25078/g.57617 Transcript_25078/m.57617 type:complete len:159 (-) Transcript_25078:118-594(-)